MKSLAQHHVALLNQSRLRLGIGPVKKQLVWTAAARLMGSPVPASNVDGYALLEVFLRTNYVASVGQIVVRDMPEAKQARKEARRRNVWNTVTSPHRSGDAFLETFEWRQLRMVVLKKRGPRCECCGAKAPDVRINVDHVKPRRKYPELALEESNLQVLCEVCNHGKGSWDETDWRASGTTQGEARGLPIPGTATATSTESERGSGANFCSPSLTEVSSCMPRLVRRR